MSSRSQYYLKPHEVSKLLAYARVPDRILIEFLAYQGLRRFEAAKVDIRDFDFERKTMRIIGKNNKDSVIPVLDFVLNDVKFLIGSRKEGLLFPSKSDPNKCINVATVNGIVARTGRKAGLSNPDPRRKNINPHLLRHTTARMLKDMRVHPEIIKEIMRHSSYKTTMDLYGTPSFDKISEDFREGMGGII